MRKLLICPYFGDLPPWIHQWSENVEATLLQHGYEILMPLDENEFRRRVRTELGVDCPPMWNTGKIWDFRPALGVMYADELQGFDWWGHTDFDCVYGRVERFYTDEALADCDIFTDCAHGYIAGPWTLYRNVPDVNNLYLFADRDGYKQHLESPTPTAWIEGSFTDYARSQVRLKVVDEHAYTEPNLLWRDGDRLMHSDREIPFFHFRRSKAWPL